MIKFLQTLFLSLFLFGCQSNNNHYVNKNLEPSQIKQRKTGEKSTQAVAIFMPLSSKNELATRLAEMVRIGLQDSCETQLESTLYDCSTKELANKSIDDVIKSGTKVVIGPIFSEAVEHIKHKAKSNGIHILTLSNNPLLVDHNVFVFGHEPLKQVQLIISYLTNKGHKDFILLIQNEGVKSVTSALSLYVKNLGGRVVMAQNFGSLTDSIADAVDKVNLKVDEINENLYATSKPAILLQCNDCDVRKVFDFLIKNNTDKKAVIFGSNKIDISYDKDIQIIVTGSDYAKSSLAEIGSNFTDYHLNYMDRLAYDVGVLCGYAIYESLNSSDWVLEFLKKLKDPQGFTTLSGYMRFENNVSVRRYDILLRKGNKYEKLSQDSKLNAGI